MLVIDDIVKEFSKEVAKRSVGYLENVLKKKKEDIEHFFSNKFELYFEARTSYLNTSTSQLFRNKDYKITDLYEPLSITNKSTNKTFIINEFPEDLTAKNKKIIIVDNAGMGKSTILKMLFMFSINQRRSIPFYIDLKSMIKDGAVLNLEDLMISEFPSFSDVPNIDFIEKQLDKNKFTFLLDGADEVPDSMKKKVFDNVSHFQKRCINAEFIMATRNEDIILSSFNDYQIHEIEELRRAQAYNIIRNYRFKDVDAENLIYEIEKEENKPVLEFLKNPLLTTLLYTAYSFKRTIPLKKSHFFKQIYQSLYENHDATKIGYLTREKKSGLDIDAFEKILSHIAFLSRVKEKLSYKEDELIETINEIKTHHPSLVFDTRSFIHDVTSRVPVIKKDGLNYFWQHKSIQEYFFVVFITKIIPAKDRDDFVKRLSLSDNVAKFKLAFDILFDEDEELFHRAITNDILNCFKSRILNYPAIGGVIGDFYLVYADFSKSSEESEIGLSLPMNKIRNNIKTILADLPYDSFELNRIIHCEGFSVSVLHDRKVTLLEVLYEKKVGFVDRYLTDIISVMGTTSFISSDSFKIKCNSEVFLKKYFGGEELIGYKVNVKVMESFVEAFENARTKITESLMYFDIGSETVL